VPSWMVYLFRRNQRRRVLHTKDPRHRLRVRQ